MNNLLLGITIPLVMCVFLYLFDRESLPRGIVWASLLWAGLMGACLYAYITMPMLNRLILVDYYGFEQARNLRLEAISPQLRVSNDDILPESYHRWHQRLSTAGICPSMILAYVLLWVVDRTLFSGYGFRLLREEFSEHYRVARGTQTRKPGAELEDESKRGRS